MNFFKIVLLIGTLIGVLQSKGCPKGNAESLSKVKQISSISVKEILEESSVPNIPTTVVDLVETEEQDLVTAKVVAVDDEGVIFDDVEGGEPEQTVEELVPSENLQIADKFLPLMKLNQEFENAGDNLAKVYQQYKTATTEEEKNNQLEDLRSAIFNMESIHAKVENLQIELADENNPSEDELKVLDGEESTTLDLFYEVQDLLNSIDEWAFATKQGELTERQKKLEDILVEKKIKEIRLEMTETDIRIRHRFGEEKMQNLLQEAQNIKNQLPESPNTDELKQAMIEIYSIHDTAGLLHAVCYGASGDDNERGKLYGKTRDIYEQILSMVKQKITE